MNILTEPNLLRQSHKIKNFKPKFSLEKTLKTFFQDSISTNFIDFHTMNVS